MFKHILIPTDGSELAGKAIAGGVRLAKALGAKVTAYHAIEGPEVQGVGDEAFIATSAIGEFETRCGSGRNAISRRCGRPRRRRASCARRS